MMWMQKSFIAACLTLCAGVALAQPAAGRGPGPGASAPGAGMGMGMGMGPGASAPRMGMGPGMGRGAGRAGSDFTPGWSMMTPQERDAHRDRMRNMKSYEECKTYQEQHHAQMAERAKERGGKPMPAPRRDACAGMKK